MRAYFDGMLRYFEISGRSTRMQYWMFFIVQFLLSLAALYIDIQAGGLDNPQDPKLTATLFVGFVHIVPGITVGVRRLHDIGRSGWWYLLYCIPLAGLVVLYWACCASEPGRNVYDDPEPSRYAPSPRPARASTIPRAVRMGSKSAHAPAVGRGGLAEPERFI
jgi:uncharacterized membrane protein YhaH (DUF805 family)